MGELAGQPNYFIEKIWKVFLDQSSPLYPYWMKGWDEKLGISIRDCYDFSPKLHTIRTGNRWKAGMKIHPVINNRTKDRFQFAPILECKSVQDIEIYKGIVSIDDEIFYDAWFDNHLKHQSLLNNMKDLAINDGFPSVEAFFQYFNTDFKGQIIHWTDLKY